MTGTDTELERRLRDLSRADGARQAGRTGPAGTGRAWRELGARRERSAVARRRGLMTAAVAVVAAIVIAVPLLSGGPARHAQRPSSSGGSQPAPPRTYPGAVTARVPLIGVVAMAADQNQAWAIRAVGPLGEPVGYQLAAIDLTTDTVSYLVYLGRYLPAVAAGEGRLWLTTPHGRAGGQIVRLDPATGRAVKTIHLAGGVCTALSYSADHLFASCQAGGRLSRFWRINPHTDQAWQLTGRLPGYISSIVGAPNALWYVASMTAIRGYSNANGNPQPLTARLAGYQAGPPGGQGLVYGSGSVWALGENETLARISPYTGRVQRIYTYRNYDPSRAGGLNFLTIGGGWIWFLDNGYPFSGVLRVSMATGRPAGGVPVPPNSCGGQICSQVYYLAGSVWVPTAELLLRIDPGKLPG